MNPLVGSLLKHGLRLTANAAMAKGKEYLESKIGVSLDDSKLSEAYYLKLKQFELENEVELRRLLVEDNRISAELRKAEISADVEFQRSAQEAARVEAQSTDEFIRRTRPTLARRSFYAGLIYAVMAGIIFPIVNEFAGSNLPGIDAYILGAVYSPCLAFVGVRSIEAFSRGGKR